MNDTFRTKLRSRLRKLGHKKPKMSGDSRDSAKKKRKTPRRVRRAS